MLMKKIISISIIISLIAIGFLMITSQEIYDGKLLNIEENRPALTDTTTYSNHIEFNQDALQLKKEVVQYKITFHQDDVIKVSSKMAVLYVDETITSAYCLLTNGEQPLLAPQCLWYIPERKFLVVTPRIRISVGKLWVATLFPGKIGSAGNDAGHFEVHAGESWYLTLAVPTPSDKMGFSFVVTSLNDSMEVTQLTRHGNVDLYSATYNHFQGRYYAVKLHVLFGGSVCDIFKEITVRDGSVFHMWVAGHRNANMDVYLPNGEQRHFNKQRLMAYVFLGNESGNWKFTAKGWSFYFRMVVALLYIDIDPHCQIEYLE
jgi:hypothetical protein